MATQPCPFPQIIKSLKDLESVRHLKRSLYKEKMLLTSILSFSQNVCSSLGNEHHNLIHTLTLYHTSRLLTTLRKKPFENIVGKGENAGNQHFLFFPQCFLHFSKQISIFQSHLLCRLQILSIPTKLVIW